MFIQCNVCGKENIEVSDDLSEEVILLGIWICDDCYLYEGEVELV